MPKTQLQAKAMPRARRSSLPQIAVMRAPTFCAAGKLAQHPSPLDALPRHTGAPTPCWLAEIDGRKGAELHDQPSMRAASWNQRVR
jgi:hypothetical protein